jgi:hypothetical protein
MGLFFFLSGYFTPASYDWKGAGRFFMGRLLRLGIPFLLFYFLLSAIASVAFYKMSASLTGATVSFSWRMGVGPLWFVIMLFIFDLGYLLYRLAAPNRPEKPMREFFYPKSPAIFLFVLGLTVVSYLTRIVLVFTEYVLFFPSLAYLPQYVSFFILGTLANRNGWLRAIPGKYGKRGFIAAVLSLMLFLTAISARFGSASAFLGGGTWQSCVYALWDSIFSVGLGLGLIVFFRRFFDHQRAFGNSLQKSCFTVYIIHIPDYCVDARLSPV